MSAALSKVHFHCFVFAGAGGAAKDTRWLLLDVNGKSYESGLLSIPSTGITGYDLVVAARVITATIPFEICGAELIYQSGDIYVNQSGSGATFTGAAYGGTLPSATTGKTITGASVTNWISFGQVA